MFQQMVQDWFTDQEDNYNDFLKALLLGDVKTMNQYMNKIALNTFSYFDTGKNPSEEEPERLHSVKATTKGLTDPSGQDAHLAEVKLAVNGTARARRMPECILFFAKFGEWQHMLYQCFHEVWHMSERLPQSKNEEQMMNLQQSYKDMILDVICQYLQKEQLLSNTEQQLFRKQWLAKAGEND